MSDNDRNIHFIEISSHPNAFKTRRYLITIIHTPSCQSEPCLSQKSLEIDPDLHSSPEVVCIEMSRKLGINIDNVHIALCRISDNSLVVLSRRLVGLNINTKSAVKFQLESVSSQISNVPLKVVMIKHIHSSILPTPLTPLPTFNTLLLQLRTHTPQSPQITRQPLALDF